MQVDRQVSDNRDAPPHQVGRVDEARPRPQDAYGALLKHVLGILGRGTAAAQVATQRLRHLRPDLNQLEVDGNHSAVRACTGFRAHLVPPEILMRHTTPTNLRRTTAVALTLVVLSSFGATAASAAETIPPLDKCYTAELHNPSVGDPGVTVCRPV
jgi:hypothetical protein